MSKRFSKFLLFSAMAGAAAYGTYCYLQKKEQTAPAKNAEEADDDFDDFSEDLDEEAGSSKERSYVSLNLDKAEAFASEALHKAKEVIADSVQQVKETVRSVAENQVVSESCFTDLTALNRDAEASKEPVAEAAEADSISSENTDTAAKAEDAAPENASADDASMGEVEEFFNDEV